jgi:oxygen-dependent protoporphyrinogen oxidase
MVARRRIVTDVDIIVVGGGLAGLTAATKFKQHGLSVLVLESASEVGGRAISTKVGDVPLDLGAQFVSDFYKETRAIIQAIGIEQQLIRRSQTASIWRDNEARPVWPASPLLTGNALSVCAKLRLLALLPSLLLKWRKLDISNLSKASEYDVESTAEAIVRRCGQEDLKYFFGPLLRALLYWEAESTSFVALLAILKAFLISKATFRMSDGIGQLSQTLAQELDVKCSSQVSEIRWKPGSCLVRYQDRVGSAELTARGVVCATTASIAAEIVPGLPNVALQFLRHVTYTKTAILTYRIDVSVNDYPTGAVIFPLDATPDIASFNPVQVSSDTGRSSTRLINLFVADDGYEKYGHLDDEELNEAIRSQLRKTTGELEWLKSAELVHVQRWIEALPRFKVGHISEIKNFNSSLNGIPLSFAGDYMRAPYIEGAIISGLQAYKDLLQRLEES